MTNNYTSHTVASSLLLDGKRRTLLSWGIKMKRLTSPYITAYYVPSTFIVMLAFVSFWIPAAAHPARVALVVTNFLASCVIYRGADSNTPPTGDLNPLEKYLMMNMIVMMLVMMEYLLVIAQFPDCLEQMQEKRAVNSSGLRKKSLQLDFHARWFFPGCYALTIIVYFSYYYSI